MTLAIANEGSDTYVTLGQMAKTILVVDDDPATHELVKDLFQLDCKLESFYDGESALACILQCAYDLVLAAIQTPKIDGLTLLHRIHEVRPEARVVVITAKSTTASVVSAIREHAFSYLTKPLSRPYLEETIHAALTMPAEDDDIQVISARPDWVSLEVRCKAGLADRLAQFFRELALDLDSHDRDSISTAFRELLLNAIEHGGKFDPSQRVRLTCVRTSRSIQYYIRDPGPGFSFDNLPHAAVSNTSDQPLGHAEIRTQMGLRPGGFGILLTRNFADELLYSEKGNEVLLIKYLH